MIEAEKDQEKLDLTNKIDKISTSFSQMLKETLEKMKKKIDDANNTWEDVHEKKQEELLE